MSSELRNEKRFCYQHRLSVTRDRVYGRGEVIDWSLHGLHVTSSLPIESKERYRVRFHVEKSHGLNGSKNLFSREGEIRWVSQNSESWHLGIKLDTPLDDLPLETLDEFIDCEDSCYLCFLEGATVASGAAADEAIPGIQTR